MKNIAFALAAGLLASSASAGQAQNLLDNGNFSRKIEMTEGRWNPVNWRANNSYTLPFETFYSKVTSFTPGEAWRWNVSYPLALEGGTEYRVRFSARVESGTGKVTAGLGMNETPWSSDAQVYELSDKWRTFEYVGTTSFGSVPNSRVLFDYGHQLQNIFIDDVIVEKTNNLLSNGGFRQGLSGWVPNGVRRVENGVYVGTVATAANAWDHGLSQPVQLVAGSTYKLRFRAKTGGQGRYVTYGVGRNQAPYQDASTKSSFITEQWSYYEFTTTVPYENASISRVMFDYGNVAGDVYLDDVTLEKISQVVTKDGVISLGAQPDGSVLEFVSERVGNGYLQPTGGTKPYSNWIATRPEAHDMSAPLLRSGVQVVGTYVQDCDTLGWVSADQTVLTSGTTVYTDNQGLYHVRLGMSQAITNEPQMYGNFTCDRSDGAGMLEVFYRGVYTLFPADGWTTVGYVIRHTP